MAQVDEFSVKLTNLIVAQRDGFVWEGHRQND
jgi:hypothetical protein